MPQPIRLKDHERDARLVRRRVIVGAVAVLLLTCVLIARLYYLQVIQYEYHSTLSENNRVHVQPIPPTRGLIFDRNGVIIADNRPSFSLSVTRERAGDWEKTLDVIVEVLQLTPDDRALFERRMKQGRRPFEPVPILFELTEEQIARVAVNQFRLPGVEVVAQLVRHYPQGAHFAHSVGYVGRINEKELKQLDPVNYSGTHHIGKTGIERFYEDQLHGEVGYEEVETNARGRVLRVLKRTDPKPGKDLVLTLDVRLQEAAEAALAGRRGAIVAIEPSSGDVLAMVSQPSFDPNPFVTGISFKAYAELRDSIDRPLYNRVLRGLYPPGSTIKPMVAVSGLDAGVVTPATRVFDPGFYQLPNYDHKYRNWNRSGDGWVNLESAIMRSNDTYFYDLAHKMGIDRLHQYMSRFGFGQRVALDMFEESAGLMPSREWKRARYRQAWYPGETLILGIGQGYMQATPLQLAQATALMANRGKWIRPHLAKTIEGQPPLDPNPVPDITLRDPKFWDYSRFGMEQVVHAPRGTAHKVGATSVYRIAGKSGTAQVVAIKQGEKYDRNKVQERHRDHALFVAFAPAEDPRIAVAVMVENGEGGSSVAAPVAKQVMDAWLLGEDGQLRPEFRPPQPLAEQQSANR
ncbi:penicillin-binding protein 2 [Metapseudomonas resinovorans]|uniref:Peptidoglycan D,D-transpeptidase MrdA n=1 Tax=Metapseudomonas resinovorans NBRC 106553 TaxID=1245471 RepID=S6BBW9_METRE|nr:penicillin-binding protein 2 [Pseudomonas resinovorans]BAN46529.1 penicillin-binding protein 2 [Pseudomonas resinovorans NBRC 106553]